MLLRLRDMFPGRLYVELMRHGVDAENRIEGRLLELAYKHDLPLVATNEAFFADQSMFEAHDALLCVAQGRVVGDRDRRRLNPEYRFKSAGEMRALFCRPAGGGRQHARSSRSAAPTCPNGASRSCRRSSRASGRTEEEELRAQAAAGLEQRLDRPRLHGSHGRGGARRTRPSPIASGWPTSSTSS